MFEEYSEKDLAFYKFDANQLRGISQRYRIPSFPYFLYFAPGSNKVPTAWYQGSARRGYDAILSWILISSYGSLERIDGGSNDPVE